MITRSVVERSCRKPADEMTDVQAFGACRALGPFARWWTTEAVRRKARRLDDTFPAQTAAGHPCLDRDVGSVWPILVRMGAWGALRPAFVLPLAWRRGEPHR